MFFKDTIRKSKFYPKQLYVNSYYKEWKKNINSSPKKKLKFQKIQNTNFVINGKEGKVYWLNDNYYYDSNKKKKISPYVIVKQKHDGSVYLSRIKTLKGKEKQIRNGFVVPLKYRYHFFNKDNGFSTILVKKTKNNKKIFIFDKNIPIMYFKKEDFKNIKGYTK